MPTADAGRKVQVPSALVQHHGLMFTPVLNAFRDSLSLALGDDALHGRKERPLLLLLRPVMGESSVPTTGSAPAPSAIIIPSHYNDVIIIASCTLNQACGPSDSGGSSHVSREPVVRQHGIEEERQVGHVPRHRPLGALEGGLGLEVFQGTPLLDPVSGGTQTNRACTRISKSRPAQPRAAQLAQPSSFGLSWTAGRRRLNR
jgi:hypothetical protein